MIELPYSVPEDLSSFWNGVAEEAFKAPLEMTRSVSNDFDLQGFRVETLSFVGILGNRIHGWIAVPDGVRHAPGLLWIPPYGRESVLPNSYSTRPGYVSLSFNFHGESAFHQEKYVIARGYFADGADSPETWIFKTMFQNAVLASRVLQAQIEVDETKIGAMGISQGAGMSIWLGAWNPIIKSVCADLPFLGAVGDTLLNAVYRYPLKEIRDFMDSIPIGEARVLNTLSYYDTVFQAQMAKVPVQVTLGLKDPACRPPTVREIYEAIPTEKRLLEIDWGHDYHPSMIESNLEWFNKTL